MSIQFNFDQSVDAVYQLLTDPDFLVERSTALGELSADAEVEEYDDETVVKMTREVKRELPSVLAKMFNPVQIMKMEETWRRDGDDWSGDFAITVEGQPVKLSAEFSLKANGSGCVYAIKHACKAKIPLVGGKVEKFVLSQAEDGAKQELEFARDKLAG